MSEHSEHITSPRTYYIVTGALLVLTLVTVGAAFVDVGPLNDIVAVTIATTKALLVILYFMHVRSAEGITKLAIIVGVLFLAILIVGIVDDYMTRDWIPVPGR